MKEYFRGEQTGFYDEELKKKVKWIAYYYMSGDYDGHGCGIVAYNSGKFWIGDLGHCSCYGPWEDVPSDGVETFEEMEKHIKELCGNYYKEEGQEEKVREALTDALKENPL